MHAFGPHNTGAIIGGQNDGHLPYGCIPLGN